MKLSVVASFLLLGALSKTRADTVSVELAYETLCPPCRSLISGPLNSLYQAMPDRLSVKLVPYGNAHIQTDGSVVCQHGPQECEGNQVHACLIHLYPVSQHLPVIACMEGLNNDIWANLWQCGPQHQVDVKAVKSCYSSDGPRLIREAAAETKRMQHRYTPWVMLNGQHDENALDNLQASVCRLLQDPKPAVCNQW